MGILISIDNGGTFTDICLINGKQIIGTKTLTTPHDLTKCFVDVLKVGAKEIFGHEKLSKFLSEVDYIRYSTTAGTNALVQKKGPRLGLILSHGADIKNLNLTQDEQELFNTLVNDRIFTCDNYGYLEETEIINGVNQLLSQGANRIVVSFDGENYIEQEKKVRSIILQKYPRHLLGSVPVLFAHELTDDHCNKRRTWSALINSYLHPSMEKFLYNAENILRDHHIKNPLLIFQNDGNSSRVAKTTAIKTYGSGPRGGMEGAKAFAKNYKVPTLLTLDIGGTTSDIGVVEQSNILEDSFGVIEGIETSFKLNDLMSVGAGGSSIFKVVDGQIMVGPDSVGAAPGPACFGRGGKEATITDVNLLKGIFSPDSYFGGNLVLDKKRAEAAILDNIASPLGVDLETAILLMEEAYNEKIASGLLVYKEESNSPKLLAFGGAGPMNACGIARKAKINEVIIPRLAAVFSAFGISFSDIAHEYQVLLNNLSDEEIEVKKDELLYRAKRDMFSEGFEIEDCQLKYLFIYENNNELTSSEIILNEQSYLENSKVYLQLKVVKPLEHFEFTENSINRNSDLNVNPVRNRTILNEQKVWESVPVYAFKDLQEGFLGQGPILIENDLFTCNVLKGWEVNVNENRDILLKYEGV